MKNWLKIVAVALVALAFTGCKPDLYPNPAKEVTPHTLAGQWKLVCYSDGNAVAHNLAEGSYVYLEFTRKDRTFTEFQNINNAFGTVRTGVYNIYTDEEAGAVIRGMYDYGAGDWAHRYSVTLFDDEMVWIALDDPYQQCVYERCEIPEEIASQAPAEDDEK